MLAHTWDPAVVPLSEAVDGHVGDWYHKEERKQHNIHKQSVGMVEREADAPAVVPDRQSGIFQQIVEVVVEDLLPPHADRVAPDVLGKEAGHHPEADRDEVIDDHQEDRQPGLAEPFGSCSFEQGLL